MSWLQLKLDTEQQYAEIISHKLSELGAAAVTLQDAADQPLYEPAIGTTPLWNTTRITGLFTANTNMQTIIAKLAASLAQHIPLQSHVEPLGDKDWVRAWMDDFSPIQFTDKLWICPSWMTPPDAKATSVMLEPGLAFGSGTHPTTAMCMKWLGSHPVPEIVIDYGCGSGILAVSAALLGAKTVIAVDNDAQAITATRQNAQKNHVLSHLACYLPEQVPHSKAGLIIANILAEPLISLAPTLCRKLQQHAVLLLSGILESQATAVISAYADDIQLEIIASEQQWVCLSGTFNR